MAALRITALVLLAACSNELPDGSGNGSGSGSGSAADAAVDAPKVMWIDAAGGSGSDLPCENPANYSGIDGHHEPGKSCFQACHNHGFTLAGTLYTNATGNSPFAGATITVVDATNKTVKIVTAANGNFYTKDAIAFPALVMASSCPSAVRMEAAVVTSGRACNTCHVGGTNDQMHLP